MVYTILVGNRDCSFRQVLHVGNIIVYRYRCACHVLQPARCLALPALLRRLTISQPNGSPPPKPETTHQLPTKFQPPLVPTKQTNSLAKVNVSFPKYVDPTAESILPDTTQPLFDKFAATTTATRTKRLALQQMQKSSCSNSFRLRM